MLLRYPILPPAQTSNVPPPYNLSLPNLTPGGFPSWVLHELRPEVTPSGLVINECFYGILRIPGDSRGFNLVYGNDTGPLPPDFAPHVGSNTSPARGWIPLHGFHNGPQQSILANPMLGWNPVNGFDRGPLPPAPSHGSNSVQDFGTGPRPLMHRNSSADFGHNYYRPHSPNISSPSILGNRSGIPNLVSTARNHIGGSRRDTGSNEQTNSITPSESIDVDSTHRLDTLSPGFLDCSAQSQPIDPKKVIVEYDRSEQDTANFQSRASHKPTVEDAEEAEDCNPTSTNVETEISPTDLINSLRSSTQVQHDPAYISTSAAKPEVKERRTYSAILFEYRGTAAKLNKNNNEGCADQFDEKDV